MDNGEPSTRVRVLVIDDHLTFAELLTATLDHEPDFTSVGHAVNAADGIRLCNELRPDLVIIGVWLPDGDGFNAISAIQAAHPLTRIIVLTAHATVDTFERAAQAGACGFLPKDGSLAAMLQTLRRAHSGGLLVDPAMVAALGSHRHRIEKEHRLIPLLTPRETAVLEHLGAGTGVSTIAGHLNVTPHTCRGYVKSILSKLGAHTQLEAVVIATRLRLIRWDQTHPDKHPRGDS